MFGLAAEQLYSTWRIFFTSPSNSKSRAKFAVRVWAVEVLLRCRGRVTWLGEIEQELLEAVGRDASPGIAARMRRRWWREFGVERR